MSDRKIAVANTSNTSIYEEHFNDNTFLSNPLLDADGLALSWLSTGKMRLTTFTDPDGRVYFPLIPLQQGLQYNLQFDISYNMPAGDLKIYDVNYNVIQSQALQTGNNSITFTATNNNLVYLVIFENVTAGTGPYIIDVDDIILSITSGQIVDHYFPEILSATDYYSFGSPMPGRKFNGNSYRYGFQNQEKDDEIYGEGNAVSFEYRVNDTRLGRFLSIDPLAASFPWNSPYAFSENRVISAVELEGLEAHDLNGSGSVNHDAGVQGPQPQSGGTINGPYANNSAANAAALGGAAVNLSEIGASANASSAISDRIANPYKIEQGNSSLCGMTCLAQALAKHDPDKYRQMILDYYQKNQTYNEGKASMNMTSESDWYMLSGLKKETTPYYGSQQAGSFAEQITAMTTPGEMTDMANKLGFTISFNTTSILPGVGSVDKFFSNLDKQGAGKTVIMLINSDVLQNRAQYDPAPSHWIIYQVGTYQSNGDGSFQFKAQTWGTDQKQFGPINKARADLKGLFGAMIIDK